MKVISFADIKDLGLDPLTCIEWVDAALRNKADAQLPPKVSIRPNHTQDGTFVNTMPCFVGFEGRGGVKVVSRYPGRVPALSSEILLYDSLSGECLALMDGDWITTMRTGAVAAHAIQRLAVPGFTHLGFMGLGNTAMSSLVCIATLFSDRELEVGLLRYKDQAQEFAKRFGMFENVKFHVVEDVEDLARSSQVLVSCVTSAPGEFCGPEAFAPGSLLIPIHTRGFMSCDLAFDRIVCDDEDHVSSFGYYPQFKHKLVEMSDVLLGNKPGRESDDQRIIAYNIGIALHDMVFASKIYDMLADDEPLAVLNAGLSKHWF